MLFLMVSQIKMIMVTITPARELIFPVMMKRLGQSLRWTGERCFRVVRGPR
jgi:hypothetical protein